MGGCTNCASKGGCSTRKASEKELLAHILPQIYPTRRWGDPDDTAWHQAGVAEAEGQRLARQAAEICKAPTYFVPGGEDEVCDHIYVLCVGRAPGLVTLRDADSIDVVHGDYADRVEERYLRLSLSRMARVAALQEVALELVRDAGGPGEADLWVLSERPRAGVYDPILLARTQKLVELVVRNDITYLDFALVVKSPDAYEPGATWDAGDYADRYGAPPGTVNYLFYPQPATAASTVYLPARAA